MITTDHRADPSNLKTLLTNNQLEVITERLDKKFSMLPLQFKCGGKSVVLLLGTTTFGVA